MPQINNYVMDSFGLDQEYMRGFCSDNTIGAIKEGELHEKHHWDHHGEGGGFHVIGCDIHRLQLALMNGIYAGFGKKGGIHDMHPLQFFYKTWHLIADCRPDEYRAYLDDAATACGITDHVVPMPPRPIESKWECVLKFGEWYLRYEAVVEKMAERLAADKAASKAQYDSGFFLKSKDYHRSEWKAWLEWREHAVIRFTATPMTP